MPTLGDLIQSFGYGASAGLTEPASAALVAAAERDPGLFKVLLESRRQEREQRRRENPTATTLAELGGSLASGGLIKNIPQNIAAGLVGGYNESGNVNDALTGAALTGAVSGITSLPRQTIRQAEQMMYNPGRGPTLREMLHEGEKMRAMKEHSEKVLEQQISKLTPYQASERSKLLSAMDLDINRIDLDKMPPDSRELLTEAHKKYMERAGMAQNMENLSEETRNSLLRMLSYDKQLYQSAYSQANKNFARELPKTPEQTGPSLLSRLRSEINKPVPMHEFVAQAMARYKAGAQNESMPQTTVINIPK